MILLFALFLAAEPAPAAAPAPATVTVTAPILHYNDPLKDDTVEENTASDDTVICHKSFATGSRLNVTKVCMTKRHWANFQHEQAGYFDQQTAMKH